MSIVAALYTDSQSRLFRWLFGQPARRFHLSELRRLTGLGSASLQRELRKLTEAELVSSEQVGNLRCFQANSASPVFSELESMTQKLLGIEPMLREALLPLIPKLRVALMFGSVAKRTDKATSDIDVMLIGDKLSLASVLKLLLPLETELDRKINPTCYTVAEFKRRRAERDSFVNRVLAQRIVPLIGDIDELGGAR